MLAAALSLPLAAPTALAQGAIPADNPSVRHGLDGIKSSNAWILEQQVSLCEIPAPPFKEQARGIEFRKRLAALGYPNARVDSIGNVIAERPGSAAGPTVMIAGHLDTVFPEGTNVKVKRTGDRFDSPGIGDDCRGLAVVLAVAKALNEGGVRTTGRVILVGDVGEEGPGNLRGVRHLLTGQYKGKVDYFISIDGLGIRVTNRAVGSKRFNVRFTGPGGHSYGAFGMPSAIHAMGRAIANISEVQVPTTPKTTFNVGVVSGGTSVNSIAGEAAMDVDMRSEAAESLEQVEASIRKAVADALAAENARWPKSPARIAVRFDTIGIRPLPSTPQSDDSPIVRTAFDAARALGERVPATGAGSTDSNIPMNLGIPAITIGGGGSGGNAHALNEWYQDGADGYKGPQWALLIVATLAGVSRTVTP
jgi:acetylornithine deacetylase/succinyl-diaminopimelate desuccinylase-like protein